ncbi:hypothetical protein CPB83DRAFT_894352 [Crepidotus variabilis]|uniref:JmjC domain-containing protein n=1 Tax=Crepidotus variabilis TaxID=179855 RepID=A0A9P6EGH3_9AGAR|nr:hypothetical protein CPB83DRAFT_894352 [Crepidotus variabilis]
MTSQNESFQSSRFATQQTFYFDRKSHTYTIFKLDTAPTPKFGTIGDISIFGERRWVRLDMEWVEVQYGMEGEGARPAQTHPVYKSRIRLDFDTWKSTSNFNPQKKRKRTDTSSQGGLALASSMITPREAPILGESSNPWILDLLNQWNRFPIINLGRAHSVGESILKELLNHPLEIQKAYSGSSTLFLADQSPVFEMAPTGQRVINDLMISTASNVWDFVNRYIEPNVKASEVLASVLHAAEGTLGSESHFFGVLDIPSSDTGISSCLIKAVPFVDKSYGSLEKYGWSSTLTPVGAVSHTHMDFYGARQFMVHIQGRKLWLLWPPTTKNLEWFKMYQKERPSSDFTTESIRNLEGLQYYYLDGSKPAAFTLQSNTFHACISFSTCMHTALKVWSYDAFPESQRLMEWGLEWVRNATSIKLRDTLHEQLVTMEEEIEGWETLLKQNPRKFSENTPIKVAVKRWRDTIGKMKSSLT